MIDGVTGMSGADAMSQMRQILFRRFDTNGDGVIDKAEMTAALSAGRKHPAGSPKGSPTLDQAFAKLDTNNDGVISQSEFSAALSSGGSGSLFSGATSSLVDFLTSGAGPVSGPEGATSGLLKNYLAQCSEVAKQRAAQTHTFTKIV